MEDATRLIKVHVNLDVIHLICINGHRMYISASVKIHEVRLIF